MLRSDYAPSTVFRVVLVLAGVAFSFVGVIEAQIAVSSQDGAAAMLSTAAVAPDTTDLAGPRLLSRNEEALALMAFPWKDLGYEIVFKPPRKGFRAMTFPNKRRIEIYARPGDAPLTIAHDIAHEIGHAIDVTFNTNETRKKWMKIRGIKPSTRWFTCKQCSDYNAPAGDFAETFAFLLLGPEFFRSRLAPPPTDEQVRALVSFFPNGYINLD